MKRFLEKYSFDSIDYDFVDDPSSNKFSNEPFDSAVSIMMTDREMNILDNLDLNDYEYRLVLMVLDNVFKFANRCADKHTNVDQYNVRGTKDCRPIIIASSIDRNGECTLLPEDLDTFIKIMQEAKINIARKFCNLYDTYILYR